MRVVFFGLFGSQLSWQGSVALTSDILAHRHYRDDFSLFVRLRRLDQLDALSWQWITQHENLVEQVWHTRQGTYRRKRPPDVRDDPMHCQ